MITRADFLELARRLRYPTLLVAVAIGYLGAAKLGLLAAVAQKVVSSAWPPSGVALAALLLLGLRYWPGIAMGAFLLNWTASVPVAGADRKSTRLNSSHSQISYAVFCLKKKKKSNLSSIKCTATCTIQLTA